MCSLNENATRAAEKREKGKVSNKNVGLKGCQPLRRWRVEMG
jgi:hypothetical protein